ncbi:GH25 family lysozyme [Lacticaseibacillus hegangensis]|uniref:GH25 family lysozyme n=1 Tax=Lacticaseibacillus hegangensis TaxID=2486010 RepID=A0ABW4CWD5_9LACO|nr:GH25 family lysozyme [Lacticaseibacillus hegangensis]
MARRRRKRPIYSNTYIKRRRIWTAAGALVLILALVLGGWLWTQRKTGVAKYPVRGVALSQSDGSADFQALQSSGLAFVYLKSTQGASFFDDSFATNYQQASGSGLAVGVYHYFSFDSDPAAQADYFAAKVGKNFGTLPIGLHIAYYGDYASHPPKPAVLRAKVQAFVVELRRYTTRPLVFIGSPAVLGDLKGIDSSARRWVISARRPRFAGAAFWQDGKLEAAGDSYSAVAFLGTKAALKKLAN